MPYCGDTSLVKTKSDHRTVQVIRCRSWRCPDCQPSRSRRLIAEAHGGQPNTFLTLTCRRIEGRSPEQAARLLADAWRRLRLRAMRKYKLKSLPFIAIFEAHLSGYPHLHLLLRSQWLDFFWLQGQMAQILDSPRVNIKRIDNKGRVAGYIAKYCGKAPGHFGTCKRYWKSKDYEKRPERLSPPRKDPNDKGERVMSPFAVIVRNWRAFGWRVIIERPGFARAFDCHTVPP